MAVTISGANVPLNLNVRLGPFEQSNGDLWVIAKESAGSGGDVAGWRSQNGGTNWSNAASSTSGQHESCDAVQDGDTIYVALTHTGSSGVIQIWALDMSTQSWSRVDSGTGPTANTNISGDRPLSLALRSDGSVVVFYNGPTQNVMGIARRRVYCATWSSPIWQNAIVVDGIGSSAVDADARVAVLGGSDLVHLFFTRSDQTTNLLHRARLTDDSFGTQSTVINNGIEATVNYPLGTPVAYNDAGTIKVVLPYDTTVTALGALRFDSAQVPSTSGQTIASVEPEVGVSNPAALAADGTTVHALYVDESTDDLWHDHDSGNGSWGTDTEVQNTVTVLHISANKITGAIGYVFDDNGTVKFDKVTLAGGTVTFAAAVAGSGSVSANTVRTRTVAVSVTGLGTVAANKARTRGLATNIAGAGAVTAGNSVTRALAAAVSGLGEISADISRIKDLAANITGLGTVAAAIVRARAVAASVAGQGSVAAAASVNRPLSASISGQGAVTAATVVARSLSTSISGVGSVVAGLGPIRGIAASISGAGTVAGDLVRVKELAVAISGLGAAAINLVRTRGIAASVAGDGTVSPTVATQTSLSTNVSGVGAVAPSVTKSVGVETDIEGAGALVAEFDTGTELNVNIAGNAQVNAGLVKTAALDADIHGEGQVAADTSVTGAVADLLLRMLTRYGR